MLEPYQRGKTWWAKGRIEYNGRPITEYIRQSTESATEAGAWDWIRDAEERAIRRYLVGEQAALTFADAVMLYEATETMAKYLLPILDELGAEPVSNITPKMIRDLGPKLYPNNSTDTWRRWVITPARAVINNAHDLGKCGPIKIKGYSTEERNRQDAARGKMSRPEKTPGSWPWLLRFREHAGPYHSALALFMFATGCRVGQAVAMRPRDLDLNNAKVRIPGAKGHADQWVTIQMEIVVELANLPPKAPRGHDKIKGLRVFGFASKDGPRKGWITACKKAGIEQIMPHAAGRHGFGQENVVRQGVDKPAVAQYGRWSDPGMLDRHYTHGETSTDKIHAAFRTGLVQGELETGLKLLKVNAK